MIFKIPKTINIMGRTVTIEFDDNINKVDNSVGLAIFNEDKIKLVPLESQTRLMTEQELELAFIHELVHWILSELDYSNLNDDESFINRFSSVLYQAMKQIVDKR